MAKHSELCRMQKVKFEGYEVNIPAGYDSYMRRLYGDSYMELPPAEKRERHALMEFDLGDGERDTQQETQKSH